MYAAIFSQTKGGATTDANLIRHICYNVIRHVKKNFGAEYGRLVICIDSGNTWRKQYFPEYKAARKQKRDESPSAEMDAMFDIIYNVQNELIDNSPYPCIKVKEAEADDIIAVLSKKVRATSPHEKILVVSNDRDFFQLHTDPDLFQYKQKDKSVIHEKNPRQYLVEQVARGDKNDGIPNVLSDDDSFINDDKRQTPLTRGKLKQILDDPKSLGAKVYRNWQRNSTLIDFDNIPTRIVTEIHRVYNDVCDETYKSNTRGIKFYTHLLQNDMKLLSECVQEFMTGEV